MSAIAPLKPRRSATAQVSTPLRLRARQATADPPTADRHRRGGCALFEVTFRSAMSDADLDVLRHVLDLSTHMHPKMRPDPNSPGVARLDHFSGLFLERGAAEREWTLEGRSWGQPAAEIVHEWHLLAAQAARQLDPSVALPEPLPGAQLDTADRPLGWAANGRLGHLRRRLVGLR